LVDILHILANCSTIWCCLIKVVWVEGRQVLTSKKSGVAAGKVLPEMESHLNAELGAMCRLWAIECMCGRTLGAGQLELVES